LHLVQKAIEDNIQLKASDIEFKLSKPSYTIDTLIHLKEKYPKHNFSVIMGSDSFSNIKNWKNNKDLLRDYPILVYKRPGFDIVNTNAESNINILSAPLLEISATTIRENIKHGKSIQYLVSDVVNKEIVENGYYK
jgi:nicotinate-nucleotide adenylyltransferase